MLNRIPSLLENKPMVLFIKYPNQTHIQSRLYQRQKRIFHNGKLIYTQNLKFYLNKLTQFRSEFNSLR